MNVLIKRSIEVRIDIEKIPSVVELSLSLSSSDVLSLQVEKAVDSQGYRNNWKTLHI